jgi:hypothetical protein
MMVTGAADKGSIYLVDIQKLETGARSLLVLSQEAAEFKAIVTANISCL